MVVGTTLFKMDGNAFFSPEFPRGGLAATFSLDITNLVGSPSVTITIQHRNSDDTSFSDAGDFGALSTLGAHTKDQGSLKEILRFKYEFDAGDAATDGIHFLMQAPSWRPY
jgi:hypothetical protein